jgi:hypothetical protein
MNVAHTTLKPHNCSSVAVYRWAMATAVTNVARPADGRRAEGGMTLHVLPDLEQRSDEWHEQRRGMVTASVVGQLLTPTLKVASNDTSRGVTAALVAERVTGWTEPTYINADMWRGIEHEPIARDKYAEVNGVEVREVGFMVLERDGWRSATHRMDWWATTG